MQHETAKSVWHAFSFHDQTYKMAEIGGRKEEHRRIFENWLEKHNSRKCSVITADECEEIKQHHYIFVIAQLWMTSHSLY